MDGHIILGAPPLGDMPGVAFKQARYFRVGRRGLRALWVVIHTAECGETDGAAEGLLAYAAAMDDGHVASWTYAVDRNSITQSVREKDTAFHAPPVNDCSIGIETAGRAAQTTADWADAYSMAMITQQLVPLVASVCLRNGIPPRVVTPQQLGEGLKRATDLASLCLATKQPRDADWARLIAECGGLTTHVAVSQIWKKSNHADPGANFPMGAFADQVQAALTPTEHVAP